MNKMNLKLVWISIIAIMFLLGIATAQGVNEENAKRCLSEFANSGIVMMGLQGGDSVFDVENGSVNLLTTTYYADGEGFVPEIGLIEQGFSDYMRTAVLLCSEQTGVLIQDNTLNTKTTFFENNSVIEVGFTTANREMFSYSLDLPVRVGHLHGIAKEIVNLMVVNNGTIPREYLFEQDVQFLIQDYENGDSLVAIYDNSSLVNGELFVFAFGIYESLVLNQTVATNITLPVDEIVYKNVTTIKYATKTVAKRLAYNKQDKTNLVRIVKMTMSCPIGYSVNTTSVKYNKLVNFNKGTVKRYKTYVTWTFDSKKVKSKQIDVSGTLKCTKKVVTITTVAETIRSFITGNAIWNRFFGEF